MKNTAKMLVVTRTPVTTQIQNTDAIMAMISPQRPARSATAARPEVSVTQALVDDRTRNPGG